MPYTQHKGFDCSHYQADPVQFHTAKNAGYDFCMIKATEGMGIDPTFKDRQPRVRQVWDVNLFYHFMRSRNLDAADQGKHLADTVGPLKAYEYAMFDLEDGYGMSGTEGIQYAQKMIDASGYNPAQIVVYLSEGWATGEFGDALKALTDYHLCDARYSSKIGSTLPWSAALIWQYDQYGTVPGIGAHSVDLDFWLDGHWPLG